MFVTARLEALAPAVIVASIVLVKAAIVAPSVVVSSVVASVIAESVIAARRTGLAECVSAILARMLFLSATG